MTSPPRPDDRPLADSDMPAAWTFFRQWLKNPLGIAALSPSGRQLTRQMISELPHEAKRVVELAGGAGGGEPEGETVPPGEGTETEMGAADTRAEAGS